MGRIKNPMTFTKHFRVPVAAMKRAGVQDVLLNVDTRLFIDPLLLSASKHPEMNAARRKFISYFETVVTLLSKSATEGDVAWRNAKKLLRFREIRATCLGYGSMSVGGSAFGPFLSDHLLRVAKEIVDLGVDDPDLFLALSLIEEGIGPDRISDMTTNVILADLVRLNERILGTLKIKLAPCRLNGVNTRLPLNPFLKETPVLLVPNDILRPLPIVLDWDDIQDAAFHNEALRDKVNRDIGEIWRARTHKDKAKLREMLTSNEAAFRTFLDIIHRVDPTPYDAEIDKDGIVSWLPYVRMATTNAPLDLRRWARRKIDIADVETIVRAITAQFKTLVEKKGLWKEFWAEDKPRPEVSAQRLFFAVADSYCKANDLDLTPEASTGTGPVDFKVSEGYKRRVLVEVKLSSNSKVVHGYQNQLQAYKDSEDTASATYLVIDLGNLDKKGERLIELYNAEARAGGKPSELVFVDASPKESASKR